MASDCSCAIPRAVRVRKTSDLGDKGPYAAMPRDEFPRFSVSEAAYGRLEDGDRLAAMNGSAGTPPAPPGDGIARATPLLVRMIARLALSRTEIAALPDASGNATTAAVEHELSRKRLRTDPSSGGFTTFNQSDAAYIPSAGNDYSFAQPHLGTIRDPILGTLAARCSTCHGSGPHLFTFALTHVGDAPPVKLLSQPNDDRTRLVTERKQQRDDYKRLRALLTAAVR